MVLGLCLTHDAVAVQRAMPDVAISDTSNSSPDELYKELISIVASLLDGERDYVCWKLIFTNLYRSKLESMRLTNLHFNCIC